ncbi:glucan endo-1,3-beta-glucosidase 12-like [Lotus japonicus]|uniref:glucan endo-1,3-beta-glucosidase 12-like n=1 Tax=Lotus japonicus TaxID=34305 RepID=UPI00258A1331|nr:glucan endo-1,3-beta-glucosidase 12-like [Lotus japonicus]
MAKEASLCLLLLSVLIISCSGTLVGFSYHETRDTPSTTSAGNTFFQKDKIFQSQIWVSVKDLKILSPLSLTNSDKLVDFFLNKILVENVVSGVSWEKAHLVSILPLADTISIIARCDGGSLGQNEIPLLFSTLKSVHSVLTKLQLSSEVKISVAFPLSFLENLSPIYENDLLRVLGFIKKINSIIMIEDSIDGELGMDVSFVQSVIKRASLAASILPCKDVPIVLTIKNSMISSSLELAQFSKTVSKYLEANSLITKRVVALYVEAHTSVQKGIRREEEEILEVSKVHIRRTLKEASSLPTPVSPINPASGAVIAPPETPAIITVPSTNPVTVSPTNPTTPVPLTPTNPANSPVPVTNPVTAPTTFPGAQPVTNPMASYPPPSGSVPGVNNPQPPPQNTNAQGSWCVAKTGIPETTLQLALDYACGKGTADCSQIQQGGSCYNPNSLQNHASVAFNSYYQKNPAPTSCDFGGVATIVTTNPSSGSCIYPSSSGGAGSSGSISATPPSDFGSSSPPDLSASQSAGVRPFISCMVLVMSLVSGRLITSI